MLLEGGLVPGLHRLEAELLLEEGVDAEHLNVVVHNLNNWLVASSVDDGGQLSAGLFKFESLLVGLWESSQDELVLLYAGVDDFLEHLDNKLG